MKRPLVFAPQASEPFGARVAAALGTTLAPMEEREFEGGEHKTRPLVRVRGEDVYVVQGLSGDEAGSANDRLCRMLFFIAGLKDCGAARVTACVPFLAYGRKDRRTKERDPVTLRYVAQLFEAVGTDHLIALDAHNLAAFENAFRCPVDHLEAAPLMADHLAARWASHPSRSCRPTSAAPSAPSVCRNCSRRASAARSASPSSTSVAAAAWSRAATSSWARSRAGTPCWWTTSSVPARR